MLTLAIDTSELRGSVALLRGSTGLAYRAHQNAEDYSAWLLPAVDSLLTEVHTSLPDVELFAVSTGPGSFTGLRVGLTTVKAWAEVYGTRIVGVSRLEALARSSHANSSLVAASYDAYRGQLFGALYRFGHGHAARINDELVISPEAFVDFVAQSAGGQPVAWISLDPQLITCLEVWKQRKRLGDTLQLADPILARNIGQLALERASRGEFSDPLQLDANYVRRSDAEIFWKAR